MNKRPESSQVRKNNNGRKKIQEDTLAFLVKRKEVVLGMEKTGWQKGKCNEFVGKLKEGELVEECGLRETM